MLKLAKRISFQIHMQYNGIKYNEYKLEAWHGMDNHNDNREATKSGQT